MLLRRGLPQGEMHNSRRSSFGVQRGALQRQTRCHGRMGVVLPQVGKQRLQCFSCAYIVSHSEMRNIVAAIIPLNRCCFFERNTLNAHWNCVLPTMYFGLFLQPYPFVKQITLQSIVATIRFRQSSAKTIPHHQRTYRLLLHRQPWHTGSSKPRSRAPVLLGSGRRPPAI